MVSFDFYYFLFRMSLSIKNYKEVTRSFLNRIMLSTRTSVLESLGVQIIKKELNKNKFFDENLHVLWWRIHYDSFNQIERIEPIFEE